MTRALSRVSPSNRLRQVIQLYGTDLSIVGKVIMPTAATVTIAGEYRRLPIYDERAEGCYKALREEVKRQFDFLTATCGIHVAVSQRDPYKSAAQLIQEVDETEILRVWSTAACGNPHPFFTDDENDMLRAVHDAFGHFATGRGFDANGEEIAWRAQAPMFSEPAKRALATELRGSTNYALHNGEFSNQKMGVLPLAWTRIKLPAKYEAQAVR